MKRRKRWVVGLAVALLAAGVITWKWSERPPYEFMKGARLWMVNTSPFAPETGVYSETYALESQPEAVAQAAVLELGLPSFDWGKGEKEFLFREPKTDMLVMSGVPIRDTWDGNVLFTVFGLHSKHLPSGTKTLVTICYPKHTPLTRVRAWLSDHGP